MRLGFERGSLNNNIILAVINKVREIYDISREFCSESIFTIQRNGGSTFEKFSINYISKQFTNNNCHRQQVYQIGGRSY